MRRFVEEKLDNAYAVYSMEDGAQSVHALVRKDLAQRVRITQLPRSDKVYGRLNAVRPFYRLPTSGTHRRAASRDCR